MALIVQKYGGTSVANTERIKEAVRREVEDRVAHDLPWPVVGHVAAASRLEHVDFAGRQLIGRRQDVGASTVTADAERQDRRMLDEQ